MQLAATQRPHPPPVPPRPSRQVVAEALKRSPGGPPCPTRQAPPPPSNARPWRAREPERVAAGRPVAFASTARHAADDGAALSDVGESSRVNVEVPSSAAATRIEGDPGGATAEKNDESCAPPVPNVAGKPEEAPREEKDATSRPQEATESSRTIASVDCATVVVVVDDEPERRVAFEDADNIRHQDWLEAGVRYSSTRITLPGDDRCGVDEGAVAARLNAAPEAREDDGKEDEGSRGLDFSSIRERIAMSTLQGLPPLPRSLSGFDLNATEPPPPPARSSSKVQRSTKTVAGSRPSPPARQLTTLDTQLAVLRREMFGLRQLDLSLLSQLWSLNESIQEFRQLLQEQEDRAPSPSPSSEEGDDTSYGSQPPPPPRRPGPVVHHHRPPRPPRPPPSDESPSSEEYGAV